MTDYFSVIFHPRKKLRKSVPAAAIAEPPRMAHYVLLVNTRRLEALDRKFLFFRTSPMWTVFFLAIEFTLVRYAAPNRMDKNSVIEKVFIVFFLFSELSKSEISICISCKSLLKYPGRSSVTDYSIKCCRRKEAEVVHARPATQKVTRK